jgi:thiaminase (transcriptional activator TenA)
MTFTQDLLKRAEPYLEIQMNMPFVQEMIAGTLAPDRLRYWVKVDYPYLINFSKILALGVLRAPDFTAMRTVQSYLNYIVDEEMMSHERFATSQGITRAELEAQKMGPTKYAYAQHEFASASRGELPEILTAIMPCLVGWQILSKRILVDHTIAEDNPYKWWFDTYGSDAGLDNHVMALLALVDQLAAELPKDRQSRLIDIFMKSEYYETIAWNAYYSMEEWSVPSPDSP